MLKRGFTMVEILVVVAIISLLSAVIYVSFDDSRSAAKNRALQTEVKEVQLAIELYRAQEGRYPPDLDVLTPGYVPNVPVDADSGNPNCSIGYQVDAGGGWYKLTAERCLEGIEAPEDGIGEDEEFSRCPSSCESLPPPNNVCGGSTYNTAYVDSDVFYESLAVYSFGGECR